MASVRATRVTIKLTTVPDVVTPLVLILLVRELMNMANSMFTFEKPVTVSHGKTEGQLSVDPT